MSKGVVRLGDHCTEASPHFCIGGSNNVFVNGKSICCQGDNFTEGKTLTGGSRTVFANDYGVARIGDLVTCGFKVKNGSSNVFVG
ncbi:hypothetical protein [Wolbachia endosymbiont (group E) of Neria commutata]|uniref:hypothetical protein n=1 Tax=Wolbachia endosymbiont (group E) of Neria commutata TaxID=3066149 RepID=UPI003132D2B1